MLFKLFIGNLKDIEISDMYNLLYVQAYEYLKEMFDEPFVYKVWDKKNDKLIKYDNVFEYDIFIGESEYLSRGIGTKAVNYVNNYIYENYLCDCIVLRPFDRNERAIKC